MRADADGRLRPLGKVPGVRAARSPCCRRAALPAVGRMAGGGGRWMFASPSRGPVVASSSWRRPCPAACAASLLRQGVAGCVRLFGLDAPGSGASNSMHPAGMVPDAFAHFVPGRGVGKGDHCRRMRCGSTCPKRADSRLCGPSTGSGPAACGPGRAGRPPSISGLPMPRTASGSTSTPPAASKLPLNSSQAVVIFHLCTTALRSPATALHAALMLRPFLQAPLGILSEPAHRASFWQCGFRCL